MTFLLNALQLKTTKQTVVSVYQVLFDQEQDIVVTEFRGNGLVD